MPGCHSLLGPGLLRKHQGAASHYLKGWFWDDQLRMQHRWNTRSVMRKCPLSTFSTCPRSCRARQAAESDFQEVLAADRILEVSELVPGALRAGRWTNKDVPIDTRFGQAENRKHFPRRQLLKTLDLLEPDAADRVISMVLGSCLLRSWQPLSRVVARFGVIRTKTLGAVPMTEQAVWGVGSA